MLGSGLALYDGMETLAENARESENADLYRSAAEAVAQSGSLYEALKGDARWPEYLVEMVGIGEQTGHLEEVMQGLADYYEREDHISNAVRSAVTYPLTLGAMLVVIVLVVLWKVLPVFRRVLSSMGVGASQSGTKLMNIGAGVGWVVMALVGLAVVAVLVIVALLRTGKREKVLNFIGKIFPPMGKLIRKLSSARVASVLSMMLSGGFPMEDALRTVPMVLSDAESRDRVNQVREKLENGEAFAEALQTAELFEPLHSRMVRMGVAAGREDQVMKKVADIYEEQVEEGISGMVSIIEPSLVALLAVVIGAILLAVMLPMAGILTSLV